MQVMGVTGRIYGLKSGQTANGKDKASFRVGIRKQFVTDQDKTDGKTLVFMPMMAMGPTAKFITDFFKDGDSIAIGAMEYQTYRTQNAPNEFDDAHIFKVDKVGFVGDKSNDSGNGGGGNQRANNNGGGNNQRANTNTNTRQNNPPAQQNNNQRQAPNNNNNNTALDNGYASDDDLPF
jgi:single-stranded DNA-binding protein